MASREGTSPAKISFQYLIKTRNELLIGLITIDLPMGCPIYGSQKAYLCFHCVVLLSEICRFHPLTLDPKHAK